MWCWIHLKFYSASARCCRNISKLCCAYSNINSAPLLGNRRHAVVQLIKRVFALTVLTPAWKSRTVRYGSIKRFTCKMSWHEVEVCFDCIIQNKFWVFDRLEFFKRCFPVAGASKIDRGTNHETVYEGPSIEFVRDNTLASPATLQLSSKCLQMLLNATEALRGLHVLTLVCTALAC